MRSDASAPAGKFSRGRANNWIYHVLVFPFIPVSDAERQAAGENRLVASAWAWFMVWVTKRHHDDQERILVDELCRLMIEIEDEGKRRAPYAPEPDLFMDQVYARYYYETTLKWIDLLRHQRLEAARFASVSAGVTRVSELDGRMTAMMAESIVTRLAAQLSGVTVETIDAQYYGGMQ